MNIKANDWGFEIETVELAEGLRKVGGGAYHPKPKVARTQDVHQVLRVERARWANQEDSFRKQVQRLLADFENEKITDGELIKTFSRHLYRFQVTAFMLGKRTAGNFSNSLSEAEKRHLHGQHSSEMKFFHSFVKTMKTKGGKMRYDHRADLYALGGYSVYLRGVLSGLPDVENIRWGWKVNSEKENCTGCLFRQSESERLEGFTTKDLLGKVGLPSEKTPCGHRCGCEIFPHGFSLPTRRTRPTSFKHVLELVSRDGK